MKAKEFIPASKPRNFVAKNQQTAGAGAHRDKKKEHKQGYEKHKGKGVAEGFNGISVDIEPELDYDVVYVDINGKRYNFNYWHSEEKPTDELGFRKDIPQYLKREEWYNRLDQPTKMEILHAVVQAELGNEPSEYKPTVGDEPLDEGLTTEKQILTRIRQIMYDRKLSGTESNAGELLRLKQQLKDLRGQQGVAEGFFDQFRKKQQNYGGIDVSVEKEDNNILVKATANGRELGRVLFTPSEQDDNLLVPLDLEVDERYRGQGIGATMYDYVKSLGYTIRRSQYQTDAGAGFWDKHKSGKNVWEQGVAEGLTTEKQILTRIRQIMYDRKLSGTESNAGELLRLKQQLKDLRSQTEETNV